MAIGLEMSTDTELAAVAVGRALDGECCQVDLVFYGPADGAVGEVSRLGSGELGRGVFCDPMPCAGLLAGLRATGVALHLLEAVDVAAAAYEFKAAVRGRRVTAAGHEALREAMRFAARRPLAAGFAFERRRVEADMAPLNAAAFAVWGLRAGQPFFGSWGAR
jgi:hypothetical protein